MAEAGTGRLASRATRRAGPWVGAALRFAVLAVLLLLLWHEAAASMVRTWWTNVTYNHGLLILPIAVGLVWLRRGALRSVDPAAEWRALPVLLGVTLSWLLGRAADVQVVQQAALVAGLIGVFVLAFGRAVARRLVFPLAFLFFMVPVGDVLVPPLQDVTAAFSVWALRLIDVPVFLDGVLIFLPNGVYEVAEACAGLRFLIANVVICTLFAYLAFDRWWKRGLLVALGVVVPILANGLRAFGIILIGHWSDNALAAGVDHIVYGWGFFTAVMLLLLLIGSRLADRPIGQLIPDSVAPAAPSATLLDRGRRGGPALGLTALAALILAAGPGYAAWVMAAPTPAAVGALPEPPVAPGWQPSAPATPAWRPLFPGAEATLARRFTRDGQSVDLFLAWYPQQRQGAEVVGWANRLHDGETWSRVGGLDRAPVGAWPAPAAAERLGAAEGARVALAWYWVGGVLTGDARVAKLRQAWARLTGGEPAAAAVALSASYGDEPEEAVRAMAGFLPDPAALDRYLHGIAAPHRAPGTD